MPPEWLLARPLLVLALLFGVVIAAFLFAVFLNDLPMIVRNHRRRKIMRVERRRP